MTDAATEINRLSAEQRTRFRRDGVLFPLPAFAAEEAADWLHRLEGIEERMAGRLPPAMNAKPHLLLPWLWDLVHDRRLLDTIEDLLGPDLLCWGSSFIIKQPNDGRYVSWHQDATYWGLSAPEALTAWIALTPSRCENGCLRVLPGTHQAQLPHRNTRDPRNLLGRREEVVTATDTSQAVDIVLAPGEMSVHDVLVIHGSALNCSARRRVGFAARFIPGHVRPATGASMTATLVRGRDYGHYRPERRPEGELHPTAMARHSAVLRDAMRTIFAGGERPSRIPKSNPAALPK